MASVIRDMMVPFELYQPTTVEGVLELISRYRVTRGPAHDGDAWLMAGGQDSFDWLKDRLVKPKVVIDMSQVDELKGIRNDSGGIEIGALTPLNDVAHHPDIQARYPILAQAARRVATFQIRNQATLGGNVSQDTRCWYYRGGMPCYRAGGDTCYADTPTAMNREHCLFEADRCVAVSPSDTAPALIALGAQMVIRNAEGERVVDAEDFFIGPSVDITRMTVLEPGDLLTAIRIPEQAAHTRFYFEKASDRQAFDFPLVNIASAITVEDGVITRARIVASGVAARPLRLRGAEDGIIGEPVTEEVAEFAGDAATWGARPLNYNHFKVPLLKALVTRAIRDAVEV